MWTFVWKTLKPSCITLTGIPATTFDCIHVYSVIRRRNGSYEIHPFSKHSQGSEIISKTFWHIYDVTNPSTLQSMFPTTQKSTEVSVASSCIFCEYTLRENYTQPMLDYIGKLAIHTHNVPGGKADALSAFSFLWRLESLRRHGTLIWMPNVFWQWPNVFLHPDFTVDTWLVMPL